MSIKNVVFDVGNVLIDFCYKDLMRELGFSEDTVEFLSKNMDLIEALSLTETAF